MISLMRFSLRYVGWVFLLTILTFVPLQRSFADVFDENVVVVGYDDNDMSRFGQIPSRSLMAQVITIIADAHPRSIILKFFLDTAKGGSDDSELGAALLKTDVILQASISSEPPVTSALDTRFRLSSVPYDLKLKADAGWLPISIFQKEVSKICFADVDDLHRAPLFEQFQGTPVPSMYSCALTEAFGAAQYKSADRVCFGSHAYLVDRSGELALTMKDLLPPKSISFDDVLQPNLSQLQFKDKIVVLAYFANKSPKVNLDGQELSVHQAFISGLRELMNHFSPC